MLLQHTYNHDARKIMRLKYPIRAAIFGSYPGRDTYELF